MGLFRLALALVFLMAEKNYDCINPEMVSRQLRGMVHDQLALRDPVGRCGALRLRCCFISTGYSPDR